MEKFDTLVINGVFAVPHASEISIFVKLQGKEEPLACEIKHSGIFSTTKLLTGNKKEEMLGMYSASIRELLPDIVNIKVDINEEYGEIHPDERPKKIEAAKQVIEAFILISKAEVAVAKMKSIR